MSEQVASYISDLLGRKGKSGEAVRTSVFATDKACRLEHRMYASRVKNRLDDVVHGRMT